VLGRSDTIRIDPAYRAVLEQAGLASVEAVLRCHRGLVVAWSRSSDTIQVPLGDGRLAVFIKRYHYATWRRRIKPMLRGTFFGRSRARAEFEALQTMRRLGIPAVRPIAYGERRLWHFVRSCFLITEAVPGAIPLTRFVRQLSDCGPTERRAVMRELVVGLAEHVRRMHEAGFVDPAVHGDRGGGKRNQHHQ